ncbi:MAG: FkbM family methyltransferase [Alphaproteobacteria bacterium]|nr:MAG: FkbM family methyltransferase [Alphaproteobacteria bacterium]
MAGMTVAQAVAEGMRLLSRAEKVLEDRIRALPDGPERGRLIQERWRLAQALGRERRYFSQAGQDAFLDRVVFRGKRGGVFAEIGAYDGVTGSNTLFFELFRGWSGLLVEASPTHHAAAVASRGVPCLNLAVAGRAGEVEFLDIRRGLTQMGGIAGSLGEAARAAIEADPRTEARLVRVPARPLAEILDEAGLRRLDYLSIDIEGGELEVLRGFPFAEFEIAAWSIEVNTPSPEIEEIMRGSGHRLAAHVGVDQIWLRGGG